MNWRTVILGLGLTLPVYASDPKDAAKTAGKAVLATKPMKRLLSETEKDALRAIREITGLTKKELAYVAILTPLVSKRIESSQLGRFSFKVESWRVTPIAAYSWESGPEFICGVTFKWKGAW